MHVEAALTQPSACIDILGVTELRRAEITADEVLRSLQSGILADDERVAALRDRRKHPDLRPFGADVGVERRRGADVGDVDGAGEQSFHGRRAGVEGTPFQLHPGRQSGLVTIRAFAFQLTGGERGCVGQIGKEANAERERVNFGTRRNGRDKCGDEQPAGEEERGRTHEREDQKGLRDISR